MSMIVNCPHWVSCCFTALQQLRSLAPGCGREITRCRQFNTYPGPVLVLMAFSYWNAVKQTMTDLLTYLSLKRREMREPWRQKMGMCGPKLRQPNDLNRTDINRSLNQITRYHLKKSTSIFQPNNNFAGNKRRQTETNKKAHQLLGQGKMRHHSSHSDCRL